VKRYGQKMNMGILSWILFALIAGALAILLMPGKYPGGFFVTVIIGIACAMLLPSGYRLIKSF
jgi:uncharacterized membrane protein YeaQ/YmgE (transglycosylase-associated protein family)